MVVMTRDLLAGLLEDGRQPTHDAQERRLPSRQISQRAANEWAKRAVLRPCLSQRPPRSSGFVLPLVLPHAPAGLPSMPNIAQALPAFRPQPKALGGLHGDQMGSGTESNLEAWQLEVCHSLTTASTPMPATSSCTDSASRALATIPAALPRASPQARYQPPSRAIAERLPVRTLTPAQRLSAASRWQDHRIRTWLQTRSMIPLPTEMPKRQKEALRECFAVLDVDRSGKIGYEELLVVMGSLGFDGEATRQAIKAGDANGDGELNFEEFVSLVAGATQRQNSRRGKALEHHFRILRNKNTLQRPHLPLRLPPSSPASAPPSFLPCLCASFLPPLPLRPPLPYCAVPLLPPLPPTSPCHATLAAPTCRLPSSQTGTVSPG